MSNALLIYILILVLFSTAAFFLGRASITFPLSTLSNTTNTTNTYKGTVYAISYPWNWNFDGPSEGPITGFSEFSKLVSPSGDMQIVIGLRGDNRFEFIYDDIRQETKEAELILGSKSYFAEEHYLDIDESPEYNLVILETELEETQLLGYTQGSREIFLPVKIQILYRFTQEEIPFEDKIKMYETEKAEALSILRTFKLLKDPSHN